MSLSTQLSALLSANTRGQAPANQPRRCCYCGNAYDPVTGKIVAKPFTWINISDGCCKACYPKRLEQARADGRRAA